MTFSLKEMLYLRIFSICRILLPMLMHSRMKMIKLLGQIMEKKFERKMFNEKMEIVHQLLNKIMCKKEAYTHFKCC